MTCKTCKAFVVCDENYINPAIVALTSFLKFNRIPLRVYLQDGGDYSVLKMALRNYNVEFVSCSFPELPEHTGVHNAWSDAFFSPKSLPAFAQRIKAIEEMRDETDLIINLDLDTLTVGNLSPLLERCDTCHIYGVSERENRSNWLKDLGLRDLAPMPNYFNTGMAIYGKNVLCEGLFEEYRKFLKEYGDRLFCPEQDFLNFTFAHLVRSIPVGYNLMFPERDYTNCAPVVLHFLGNSKPWSATPPAVAKISHYFSRYYFEIYHLDTLNLLDKDFVKHCYYNSQF